jgi:hypothetical protein
LYTYIIRTTNINNRVPNVTLLHLAYLGSSFEEAFPHLLQQQKQQQVMHPANGIHSINNRPITTQAAKPPNTATSCENKNNILSLDIQL